MAIKGSLLRQVAEELTSFRMDVAVRLDDDGWEGDPVSNVYILVLIDFCCCMLLRRYACVGSGRELDSSQEDDEEGA